MHGVYFDMMGPIMPVCEGYFPEIVVSENGGGKACFQWVGGGSIKVCSTLILQGYDHLEYHVFSWQTELDLS